MPTSLGERAVRHARIGVQRGQDAPVDVVESRPAEHPSAAAADCGQGFRGSFGHMLTYYRSDHQHCCYWPNVLHNFRQPNDNTGAIMRVGIPTEIKNNEFRVAITPAGVAELVHRGHEVLIQAGAGDGSAISDADFKARRRSDDQRRRRGVGRGRSAAEGQGADRARVRAACARARPCSPICTWPPPGRAPTRCWLRAPRRSPTRPCRPPTARCRCWPR